LAEHYRDKRGIFGYGLMNEPHDTGGTWPHTAQLAIDAIRTVDRNHHILLAGDQWSSARAWPEVNPHLLEVKDSSQRIIYEGHIYFDADASGVYKHSYDEDKVYPDIGVERVKPFVEWLKKNKADGLIGEFGVPGNDPRWNVVLDRFLAYLHREHVLSIYWAGGPLWHHYLLSSEPTGAGDAPQMHVLARYARPVRPWWLHF
jgi:endoglucanase